MIVEYREFHRKPGDPRYYTVFGPVDVESSSEFWAGALLLLSQLVAIYECCRLRPGPHRPYQFELWKYLNPVIMIGWLWMCLQTIKHSYYNYSELYSIVDERYFKIFQALIMIRQIVPAVLGIGPNFIYTTFHLFYRVLVIWFVLDLCHSKAPTSFGIPLVIFAWCCMEILRFSSNCSYRLILLHSDEEEETENFETNITKTPRYPIFVALWTIGVMGELVCCFHASEFMKENWILELDDRFPDFCKNCLNSMLENHIFFVGFCQVYIPLSFHLNLHTLCHPGMNAPAWKRMIQVLLDLFLCFCLLLDYDMVRRYGDQQPENGINVFKVIKLTYLCLKRTPIWPWRRYRRFSAL